MEKWKPVQGYEGFYEVSNEGRVRSVDRYVKQRDKFMQLKKGKVLSPAKNRLGYMCVALSRENKLSARTIHRLVAIAFIKNPNGYKEINHIDGNKQNNNVENIEWSTRSKNINHAIKMGLLVHATGEKHHQSKFTDQQIKELREKYDPQVPLREYAKEYNASISCISRIIRGDTYPKVAKR